ncbi:MAG: carbohydrate-binding domain-containing protein [Muribaculaceae bacterium]|nr:carbohydrate-binding domain-containing protein [Muribaculaceae bacterium]
MMRKISYGLLAVAMAVTMVSCVNDDTDMDDIIAQYMVEPASIDLDYSDLAEVADVPVTDENDSAYNDYVENTTWNKVININYAGDAVTVTGSVPGVTLQADGAHVTVLNMSGPVKFVVSGATTDGSLKFYGDKRFQILLNGAEITNPHGAAINNQGSKSLYVVLADGTVNRLQDGETYAMVEDEDQKAAFFSEGQIIFSGRGELDVIAVGRGGIRSDDYIRVRPGARISVNSSALDGLRANDGIILDGGVVNIQTTGTGAKGVRSGGPMTVNGGRLVAISTGDTRLGVTDEGDADTTACAALYCDTLLTVHAGVLKLKATGDGGKGLNGKGNMDMRGGSMTVVATGTREIKKSKGVKLDGNLGITGGSFYTYSRLSDPLEVAGTMSVAPGYVTYDHEVRVITISYPGF